MVVARIIEKAVFLKYFNYTNWEGKVLERLVDCKDLEGYFKRLNRYWNLYKISGGNKKNIFILRTIENELKEINQIIETSYLQS